MKEDINDPIIQRFRELFGKTNFSRRAVKLYALKDYDETTSRYLLQDRRHNIHIRDTQAENLWPVECDDSEIHAGDGTTFVPLVRSDFGVAGRMQVFVERATEWRHVIGLKMDSSRYYATDIPVRLLGDEMQRLALEKFEDKAEELEL